MAKLPSLSAASEAETTEAAASAKTRDRGYKIVDDRALHAKYPQFFKLVPDYKKLNAAVKLGVDLPGIEVSGTGLADDTIGDEDGVELTSAE